MLGGELDRRVGEHRHVLSAIEEEAREMADRYRDGVGEIVARDSNRRSRRYGNARKAFSSPHAEGWRGWRNIDLPEADLGEEPEGVAEGGSTTSRRDLR